MEGAFKVVLEKQNKNRHLTEGLEGPITVEISTRVLMSFLKPIIVSCIIFFTLNIILVNTKMIFFLNYFLEKIF